MLGSVVWAYMVVSCFVGATIFELGELSHSGEEFRVCEVILQKNHVLLEEPGLEAFQQRMCCYMKIKCMSGVHV